MKRIGIVTIHNSPNYGACLQSFALYEYIRRQGAYCEIIDIHRPIHSDYVYEKKYSSFRNNPFTPKKRLKNFFNRRLGRSKRISSFFSVTAEKLFTEFNSSIRYSQTYNKLSELKKNPPQYDVYISGSDQLWNPAQPYCLEPYFLTFAPSSATKISYATSIGITELTEIEKTCFEKWLSTYDAVSVREKQGKALLNSFLKDKEVSVVADPTFLLDRTTWNEIANYPNIQEKYIAVFLLCKDPQIIDYALRLSRESGYKLIFLKKDPQPELKDCIIENNIGPREFLGYLSKADIVITDSFHCTVFSILMGAKNFVSYISPNSKRGSRIIDLLDLFGLDKHLLPSDLSLSFTKLEELPLDVEHINKIIECEKNNARTYLDKWIK